MDKTIFTKTKKSWDSGEFTDYVLTDKAPNYYFEITSSSESMGTMTSADFSRQALLRHGTSNDFIFAMRP